MLKQLLFIPCILLCFKGKAQPDKCVFKQPVINIDFGAGFIGDLNTESLYNYRRVATSCPTDGHYSYTSYTSDCFRGDWQSLPEDHTPGDAGGNMMLVNASPGSGTFLTTSINGLKGGTIYEFSVWMMNVCKISEKCPFPLLPDITILLQTPSGKTIAQFGTGELIRSETPHWTRYQALFTTPPSDVALTLTMMDNSPGGCGNDFALDDISFRECVKIKPVVTAAPRLLAKPKAPVVSSKVPVTLPKVPAATPKAGVVIKQQAAPKPVVKKVIPAPQKREVQISQVAKPQSNLPAETTAVIKKRPIVFPAPPPVLTARSNPVIRKIETEAGEIRLDLYDNGEIDGDTISIYHNNVLLVAHARLSIKPISFRIAIDAAHPHHELVMVADNLGSIPPNTSVMVVNAGSKRYEVFITSNEQKNAKVVFDLVE